MKVNKQRTRDKIVRLVKADQRYADDDKLLIAAIWYEEGWRDPELYQKLKNATSPETIRRTRAKLVEEGVITPSEKVTEARYNDFQEAKDDLGYNNTIF